MCASVAMDFPEMSGINFTIVQVHPLATDFLASKHLVIAPCPMSAYVNVVAPDMTPTA